MGTARAKMDSPAIQTGGSWSKGRIKGEQLRKLGRINTTVTWALRVRKALARRYSRVI